LYKNN